ncbi:zinc metalloprotease [Parastagonospora nodorum]|nr:zinc metalloprotease [Parastagonospora nodorum]KAH3985333.1 zinc metalloprotease [Parastagonospora nodorum]KAH4038896.1 zinc metalloprotease [Parastagonospora nodorum]KAH4176012.1 zinc metalloprotease [Parastagonospora nodorum]KAH4610379.1 zinc metalloprotease [Parastagonospora nodorum]
MRSSMVFAVCAAAALQTALSSPIHPRHADQSFPNTEQWPIATVGKALKQQLPDKELQGILSQVSQDNIEATIRKLASFGTRHTLSSQTDPARGIGAARTWLTEQFQEAADASEGRMTVDWNSFIKYPGDNERIIFPVNITNIVATLKGSEDPDRLYVTGGHYDSRNSNPIDYQGDAPGAVDDASGVAVSLELARIFAKYQPKTTIVFTAFAGEEQGLLGAENLAQTYKNNSVNVAGMINLDMVGNSKAEDGTSDPYNIRLFCQGTPLTENSTTTTSRLSIGGDNDSPARNLGRHIYEVASNAFTEMTVRLIYRLDRYSRGGDHRPFLEAGYTGVRFVQPNEDYTQQHQNVTVRNGKQYGDLVEWLDFEYNTRAAKVVASTMWSLANAPGEPMNVGINTTTSDNFSQFKWTAPKGLPVEGYEIVYRETLEPHWTSVIEVGDVNWYNLTSATIHKDNVIFGVRSVGKGGYRSPAVLPFPFGCTRNC